MWTRPSLETIVERTKQDLESRLETAGAVLRCAVIAVIARVLAGAAHLLHGHLQFNADQLWPDTAIGRFLLRHASIWGIDQQEATFAAGNVEFEGADGLTIPAVAVMRRSDGVEYAVTVAATFSGGVASVAVEAIEAGADGNCDPGVVLTLTQPIAGINSAGEVDGDGIAGGNDIESEDNWRGRLLDRIRRPPLGGAERDYEKWAKEVPGVTRVWVEAEWLGPGTVGVQFVRDGDDDIFPDAGAVADVQDHIDEERPVTAHATVSAPVPDPVDYEIRISPDTPEVRAAVAAELDDLHYRDGEPAGTILLSRMREAISIAAGELDNELISPSADHVSGAGELPVRGDITWS